MGVDFGYFYRIKHIGKKKDWVCPSQIIDA